MMRLFDLHIMSLAQNKKVIVVYYEDSIRLASHTNAFVSVIYLRVFVAPYLS